MVGAVITIFFWTKDVEAKGLVEGTANSVLDAIPYVGIGKLIVELPPAT